MSKDIVDNCKICLDLGFLLVLLKIYQKQKPRRNLLLKRYLHGLLARKVMRRNAWKDCELANETTEQLFKVATPCIVHQQFRGSQIVLKCLDLARMVDLIYPWSVNKFLRAVTKWTRACDKGVARLISYIDHTCEYRQYYYVGNNAKHCRLGLFQDSDFAGYLEDSKSTSGGILYIFGSRTFVPRSWMCKKQTSVSHSSTKAEVTVSMQVYAWMGFPLPI